MAFQEIVGTHAQAILESQQIIRRQYDRDILAALGKAGYAG
jgi:hypothetical protein